MLLQETLKHATKPHHDELEQLMFVGEIMDGSLSLKQYKQILTTNYIVHDYNEQRLFDSFNGGLKSELELDKRIKLPALLADMDEADIQATTFKLSANTPSFNNEAASLGAMYVLEGATLGGSVIVKRLKTNPHFKNIEPGFHYYQVYGDKLIPYWKKFTEILNRQPETNFDDAIKGAKDMFKFIAAVQAESKTWQQPGKSDSR